MTDTGAIARAKALLEAEPCNKWGCDIPSPCCDHYPGLLAVAIQEAEALRDAECTFDHAFMQHPGMDCFESHFCEGHCDRCLALAAFAKLFPEEAKP